MARAEAWCGRGPGEVRLAQRDGVFVVSISHGHVATAMDLHGYMDSVKCMYYGTASVLEAMAAALD